MKAQPLRRTDNGYETCEVNEATHLLMNRPGPFYALILPVMLRGSRAGTGNWTWNGDVDKPTIKPSVRTTNGRNTVCHSFINDGQIKFLDDCTHEFKGQTLDLLDADTSIL